MSTAISSGIVTDDSEVRTAPALATRYETLVRVSRAIGAHRDLKKLFGVLVDELHRIVPFDYIGVSLRDQPSVTFQNYCIDMASRSALVPEETLTLEEPFSLSVYERQEPLLRSTDEMEPRYGRLQATLNRLRIRSICSLPLTTAHRKLGVISFCSKQVNTYSPDEIGFVSQVADQIALAFDDALNFTALRRASEELQSNNDRLHLLLNLNNRVALHLDLRQVFQAISSEDSCLQREQERILSAAVNELAPGIRTAIKLRELGELSTGETAQVMGLSIAAVKGRVFHGRRKLLQMLKRYAVSTRTYGNHALRMTRNANGISRHRLVCSACD